MSFSILIAALGFATAAPPPSAAGVPEAFLGEWRAELKDCGSISDDSRLFIEPHQLTFWESSGPVTAVRWDPPNDVALDVELTGEGETWTTTMRFRLTDDGQGLADVSDGIGDGDAFTRWRCPG